MALRLLGHWLHERHHQASSGPDADSASFKAGWRRQAMGNAEFLIAYDITNGNGVWLRRDWTPTTDTLSDDANSESLESPASGKAQPSSELRDAVSYGGGCSSPERTVQATGESRGKRRSAAGSGSPESMAPAHRDSAADDRRVRRDPLLTQLFGTATPEAKLKALVSGLSISDAVLPADSLLARMTVGEQVCHVEATAKPSAGWWVVATEPPKYDSPRHEATILTEPITRGTKPLLSIRAPETSGEDHAEDATAPCSVPTIPHAARKGIVDGTAEERNGETVFAVDNYVLDTLFAALLEPVNPHGPDFNLTISVIKIVIQPRLLVVKALTLPMGAFLKAHGLGLLAPACGRAITRVLVPALDSLLGPSQDCGKLMQILDGAEITLYAQDGRLADSPVFRRRLADWTATITKVSSQDPIESHGRQSKSQSSVAPSDPSHSIGQETTAICDPDPSNPRTPPALQTAAQPPPAGATRQSKESARQPHTKTGLAPVTDAEDFDGLGPAYAGEGMLEQSVTRDAQDPTWPSSIARLEQAGQDTGDSALDINSTDDIGSTGPY